MRSLFSFLFIIYYYILYSHFSILISLFSLYSFHLFPSLPNLLGGFHQLLRLLAQRHHALRRPRHIFHGAGAQLVRAGTQALGHAYGSHWKGGWLVVKDMGGGIGQLDG